MSSWQFPTGNARWIVIGALLALVLAGWAFRYDVQECRPTGCTMLNRWTGDVVFKRMIRQ